MKAETKYEIGQELWTITNEMKIFSFKVKKIDVIIEKGSQFVYYQPEDSYTMRFECKCFPSKEALIAHLGL